jgi:hypothetical protein
MERKADREFVDIRVVERFHIACETRPSSLNVRNANRISRCIRCRC